MLLTFVTFDLETKHETSRLLPLQFYKLVYDRLVTKAIYGNDLRVFMTHFTIYNFKLHKKLLSGQRSKPNQPRDVIMMSSGHKRCNRGKVVTSAFCLILSVLQIHIVTVYVNTVYDERCSVLDVMM